MNASPMAAEVEAPGPTTGSALERSFRRFRYAHPSLRRYLDLIAPFVCTAESQEQWLRVVMQRETEQWIRELEPERLKTLEISGNLWDRPGMFREYTSVSFPDYDVCERALDDRFDLIIAEQVFEHLLWPYRAARHVRQMLSPGGAFLITTPFLVRHHDCPVDCSRWTELGMKHFLAEAGFPIEQIRTGSWGNRRAVKANLTRWQIYQPWRHSLANEPLYPAVVWALART